MRRIGSVLLIGLVGLLSACGPPEDESASPGEQPAGTESQAEPDTDNGEPTDDSGIEPHPYYDPRVRPLTSVPEDPATETTPRFPNPVVDPIPEPSFPVVPPENAPPITPDEGTGDAKSDGPTTSEDPDAAPKASGGRAINLNRADDGKTVSAGVGDLVIVELEADPATGLAWESDPAANDATLVLKSKVFETHSQRNPEIQPVFGQPEKGFTTFTYQVADTGKAAISLFYRRPGETDTEPAKTFRVEMEATNTTSPVVTGKIVFSAEPDVEKISRIVVSIRNTALADGPAPLVGTVELKPPFQLPITFAVPYDPAKVQPNPMFYSISVRVNTVVDGSEKLYYINDTNHSVFRDANDTKCDVAVKKIR